MVKTKTNSLTKILAMLLAIITCASVSYDSSGKRGNMGWR